MLDASQIDTDVSEELCLLLQLRPAEAEVGRTVVLTTTPALWAPIARGQRIRVVDLSIPLGVRSARVTGDPQTFSSSKLGASILAYAPQAVIMDFTIPFGVGFPPKFVLHDPTSPLIGLVSDDLPEIGESRIEAQHVLLAWAASIRSVRSLSTVTLSSLTTNPGDDWLRQYLSERLQLCAVVDLPSDLLRPLASAPTSLLYFGGSRKDAYFDSLSSRGDLVDLESRPWFKSLSSWFAASTPAPSAMAAAEADLSDDTVDSSVDVTDIEAPRERVTDTGHIVPQERKHSWSPTVDGSEIARMDAKLRKLGPAAGIGELCDIVTGVSKPCLVAESDTGVILIEPRHLKDGALDVDGAVRVQDESASADSRVRAGDVLLSVDAQYRFAVALNHYNGPAILSDEVVAIRCRSDKVSPEYLFEYLSSSRARKLLSARSGADRLSVQALSTIPVPMVGPERLRSLEELQRIEKALREKAVEVQADRRSLFDVESEREFISSLEQLQRRGKAMSVSMQSLESLDHLIAAVYPFPIAYGYRLLESASDPRDLYREQFRVAENMLAFLGSLCLALLRPDDRAVTSIDPERGMTLGKWREVITLASQVLWKYEDNRLALAISALKIGTKNKGFGADVEEIVEARNVWAHMKDSSLLDEVFAAAQARQGRLKRCMGALEFLTEFPLRQIQSLTRTRTGEWRLESVCYRGDHPGLPTESVRFHGDLPDGELTRDLFLDLGEGRWVTLYPFVSVWNCQRCKWKETYFVDQWRREMGDVVIKSFERSHLEYRPEVARGLEEWMPPGSSGD